MATASSSENGLGNENGTGVEDDTTNSISKLASPPDFDIGTPELGHQQKQEQSDADLTATSSSSDSQDCCAVCLQPIIYPTQLPCGHIFCFLCVKGVSQLGQTCAICRRDIPPDYFENPHILEVQSKAAASEEAASTSSNTDSYQWFYKGRNGWWQYDSRTSLELEQAYQQGDRNCEVLIAGFIYTIYFNNMIQFRKRDHLKFRRIKRDLVTIPKKGVAGVKITEAQKTPDSDPASSLEQGKTCSSPVPVPPTNTPQTPHTPNAISRSSSPDVPDSRSLHRAIEDLGNLTLGGENSRTPRLTQLSEVDEQDSALHARGSVEL